MEPTQAFAVGGLLLFLGGLLFWFNLRWRLHLYRKDGIEISFKEALIYNFRRKALREDLRAQLAEFRRVHSFYGLESNRLSAIGIIFVFTEFVLVFFGIKDLL